jgi:hypothetical protein
MPKQEACDAAAALSARGEEGKLGALRVVASLRGETPAAQQNFSAVLLRRHHQARHLPEIDVSELLQLGIRQLLLGAEEAPVDRFGVERPECLEDCRAVLRANGANRDLRAVFQLVMNRIVGEIDHGTSQSMI